MDAYPDAQARQDRKRGGEAGAKIAVRLSLRVVDEGGVGTRRVTGKDPENS